MMVRSRPLTARLTVEEAAEILGLQRASAYEAVNRKEIPSIRIGRRNLVSKVSLERLLDRAKGQPCSMPGLRVRYT